MTKRITHVFKVEKIDAVETPEGRAVLVVSRCYAVHKGNDFRCQLRSWMLCRVGVRVQTGQGTPPDFAQARFV